MVLPATFLASADFKETLPFVSLGGAGPVAAGWFLEFVLDDQAKEAGVLNCLPLSGLLLLLIAALAVRIFGVQLVRGRCTVSFSEEAMKEKVIELRAPLRTVGADRSSSSGCAYNRRAVGWVRITLNSSEEAMQEKALN